MYWRLKKWRKTFAKAKLFKITEQVRVDLFLWETPVGSSMLMYIANGLLVQTQKSTMSWCDCPNYKCIAENQKHARDSGHYYYYYYYSWTIWVFCCYCWTWLFSLLQLVHFKYPIKFCPSIDSTFIALFQHVRCVKLRRRPITRQYADYRDWCSTRLHSWLHLFLETQHVHTNGVMHTRGFPTTWLLFCLFFLNVDISLLN